jgi:hypothetical protein
VDRAKPGSLPHLRRAADGQVSSSNCIPLAWQADAKNGEGSPRTARQQMSDDKKPGNLRTALILLSVVLMFFVGVFVKRIWFS